MSHGLNLHSRGGLRNWQFCQFSRFESPTNILVGRLSILEVMAQMCAERDRVFVTGSDDWAKQLGRATVLALLMLLFSPAVWPQAAASQPAAAGVQAEPPKDTLGRTTPRGTVLGFLAAARKDNLAIAALYLNTPLRGAAAEELARQLALVLDRRLPARLNELSDLPEGSLPNPTLPDQDLVGTISTSDGDLDIMLERIDRGKAGQVWLFSRKTLASIPNVYSELNVPGVEQVLPRFLVSTRWANVPLFEWLAVFVGLPCLYLLTGLLNRILGFGFVVVRRRAWPSRDIARPRILPPPIRLLIVAFVVRWLLSRIGLPLLARQFWSTATLVMTIAACTWLLLLLNGWGARYLARRLQVRNLSGYASVVRLCRRVVDGLILFAALLFTLHQFGVNPTAALAGLGVGGIAIALAAQKTLENVLSGVSLIADQVVRAGDTLKLGDIIGTVEDVGLRSTCLRTLDRTVVSIPNGQVANMSLENLSTRDKFWFHPVLGLRYETNAAQIRAVVNGLRKLLAEHPRVDSSSVRVRFLRFGTSSLDLDIFAYLFAHDWNHFLEIQEELLLNAMEIVQQAGAEIALPSQTIYLSADAADKLAERDPAHRQYRGADALH